MASFPIEYTQATPSGRTTGVRANLDTDTGMGQLGQAVGNLGEVGMEIWKTYDLLQANTQLSAFQRQSEEEINKMNLAIQSSLDPDEYPKLYEQTKKNIQSLRPKNPRAAQASELWLNNQLPQWDAGVAKAQIARSEDNWLAEFSAVQAEAAQAGSLDVLQRAQSMIARRQIVAPLDKTVASKLLVGARKATVEGQITNLYRVGNYDGARTATESSMFTPEEKESMINTINLAEKRATQQNQVNIDKAIAWGASERYSNINLEPMAKGQKADDIINTLKQSLSGKDLEIEIEKTQNWAMGKSERTHPIATARLETIATDIWRGNITKPDFEKELAKSLALPDTNPNAINPTEYAALVKSADTELKSSQAEVLSRASKEAGRTLVDYQEEDMFKTFISESIRGMNPDMAKAFQANANETRKLQFEYLSRYENEIRQWLSTHPDASGKEIYQYSNSLRQEYWNNATVNIEKIKNKQEIVPQQVSPYPEYPDAYQENGIWYVTKDGKRYRIKD